MLRAFLRAPSGVLGLLAIGGIVGVAILAPQVWGAQARILDLLSASQNPTLHHLAGTDSLGRDIGLRIIVATRLSVGLAFAAAGIGALTGIPAGIAATLLPGPLRSVALRAIDTMLAFPGILIAIFIGAIVGPGAIGAVLGVGIATSFSFARVSSALALSVGGREYIAAARVVGVGRFGLMFRYVFPNIAEVLVITSTVSIASAIVTVSSLSFLGLGVQPPEFDWGRMLTDGVQALYLTPVAALGPAAAIAVSALAFGFAGEALARAMNPVLWSRRGKGDVQRVVAAVGAKLAEPNAEAERALASPAPTGDVTLQVENLTVEFPGYARSIRLVDDVSFTVRRGEILGIVGETGSGKTMTLMAIAQLVPYPGRVSGKVVLKGRNLAEIPLDQLDRFLGSEVAVVFQDPMSSLNPALRVGPQLTEAVEIHQGIARAKAGAMAEGRLRDVHIPAPEHQVHRYPHVLSGGMRQRVMIAMGLMMEPSLLIADEPTTALDVTIQAQIMDVLNEINQKHGTAIILVSHNVGLVSQNCGRVLVMYAGRIVEELSVEQLKAAPLHPYSQALLAVVPNLTGVRPEKLATIPGQPPDMIALPTGCPYHPRCQFAMERCTTRRPPLITRPNGQRVACWVANQDLS